MHYISIMFTANHHKSIPCKYTPNILKKMSSWKYTFIQKETQPKFKIRSKENVSLFLDNSNNSHWKKSCALPAKKLESNSISLKLEV